MIVVSGENKYKGTYECLSCNKTVELKKDGDSLPKCICGNNKYSLKVFFDRSSNGIKLKFEEIISILSICIFLVDAIGNKAFLNPVAVQLRILLCDSSRGKDNSLIPKAIPSMKFHPIKLEYLNIEDAKIIPSYNLFDTNSSKISLSDWLNQEIIEVDFHDKKTTVRDFIKTAADKLGGAHIDTKLEGYHLLIESFQKNYLIEIGKYIIKETGYDYINTIFYELIKPIEEFKKKTN